MIFLANGKKLCVKRYGKRKKKKNGDIGSHSKTSNLKLLVVQF